MRVAAASIGATWSTRDHRDQQLGLAWQAQRALFGGPSDLMAVALLLLLTASGSGTSPPPPLPSLHIAHGSVSVSGLSSGADFVVQVSFPVICSRLYVN